jgi:hypothetical protein
MVEIPSVPPDDALTPQQLHDRVEAVTNLDAEQLRAFKRSDYNAAYRQAASDAAQPGDEPLDDTIRLLETPPAAYRDVDDGFNEVDQARELLDFQRRTQAQIASQGLGSNFLTDEMDMQRREAASIRWGIDPDAEREWL